MKIVKAVVYAFMYIVPISLVVIAYLHINTQIAVMFAFLTVPLVAMATVSLIRNKAEHGKFIFIKETEKTTESLESGFECPYCSARFSFKRKSCPNCGKNLR